MQQQTISWIAIACFFIGLAGLWVSLEEPDTIPIDSITPFMEGQRVQLQGTIESSAVREKNWFFQLSDGNTLSAAYYNAAEKQQRIPEGSIVRVRGMLSFRKTKPFLAVDSVELLR